MRINSWRLTLEAHEQELARALLSRGWTVTQIVGVLVSAPAQSGAPVWFELVGREGPERTAEHLDVLRSQVEALAGGV